MSKVTDPIYKIDLQSWKADIHHITHFDEGGLEEGKVIYFPKLSFNLQGSEQGLLSPHILAKGKKNVSYNFHTNKLKGVQVQSHQEKTLREMMHRFAEKSLHLMETLFPHYQEHLVLCRTSFRPAQVKGRVSSYRKDDTRLHIDAFPATPNQGRRLIRLFSNVNLTENREWRLGETFENVARRFTPQIKPFNPFLAKILQWLSLTRGYRTAYDHYMLHIHNRMKEDATYQKLCPQSTFSFPPGSTWIVMTDLVSHAALKGQHVLEQTFEIPVDAMRHPEKSPLRILEKINEKKLI